MKYTESTNDTTKRHLAGRRNWSIDDPTCHVKDTKFPITMSICKFPSEFTCGSGLCIDINERCDEKKDCLDGSDEEMCSLVQIPESYDNANAPTSDEKDSILNIEITASLVKINSMDTINMMAVFTLELDMNWKDNRLKFSNPRKNMENIIKVDQAKNLWTPLQDVVHENAIVGNVEYDKAKVIQLVPIQEEPGSMSHSRETVLFNGSYNPLKLRQRMKVKYDCVFDVRKFPFDGQNCIAVMKIKGLKDKSLRFVGNGIVRYNGPSFIDQFSIGKVYSYINNTNEFTKFVIKVPMQRIFTHQLLNTLIPTSLLWLFGYSTLYIDLDDFGDRFMGSATAVLVMATLLNSINADLPKTSYMKLIDLWFLWHVSSLFAILLSHIAIDRLRKNSEKKQSIDDVVSISFMVEKDSRIVERYNLILLISFPLSNCIFYGIYFYYSMN